MIKKYLSWLAALSLAVFIMPIGVNSADVSFSIEIISNPPAIPIAGSESSSLVINVGDMVDFTSILKGKINDNQSWQWQFSDRLDCFDLKFDFLTFRCKAVASGEFSVSTGMITRLSDGTVDYRQLDSILVTVTKVPGSPEFRIISYGDGVARSVDAVSLKVGEKVTFESDIGENANGHVNKLNTDVVIGGKGYPLVADSSVNNIATNLSCKNYFTGPYAIAECTALKTAKNLERSEIGIFATENCLSNGVCLDPQSNLISVKVSQGKPDLTIKAAKATLVTRRVRGVAKKQYKIGVTVSNKGQGDAKGPVYFHFTKGLGPILVTKGALESGKSKKVNVYVDIDTKDYNLLYIVDMDKTFDESNEDNNMVTRVVGK